MSLERLLRGAAHLLILAGLGVTPPTLNAQQVAQADLSLSVVVTPPHFVQGGHNTVALTVHNGGPDDLDSGSYFSITVFGDSYVITKAPPPYDVLVNSSQGCWAERFVVDLVPPNNDRVVLFAYNFGAIAAFESATCTYDVIFNPSTIAPLTMNWEADTFYSGINNDPNPSNNSLQYTFLAALPYVAPEPVPALSGLACFGALLGISLIAFGGRRSRRRGQNSM